MAQDFGYSTILFDFDGTLTPSLPLWVRAFQFTLDKYSIKLSFDDVIRVCFYRAWQDIVDEYELPSVSDFADNMHTGLEEGFEHAQPFAGVESALTECHRRNIKLGIVTSSKKSIVKQFLATHGISKFFQTVVAAEDIVNHKPHPEPVLMALDHLDSAPAGSLLIGDSHADMLAAHAAGISKALFFPDEHHGFYNFEDLKAHHPQFIFQDYSDLPCKLSILAT